MYWISVKDGKPPQGVRVLVTLAGQVWEARYAGGGRWHRYNGYDMEDWLERPVTAWAYLPKGYGAEEMG